MKYLDAATVARWLRDDDEIAFLDVREHGQYGESHPLKVTWVPYSMLEARIVDFVPRTTTRTVLLDDGDGVAERAASRLEAMGYADVHVLRGGNPAWGAAGLEVFKGVNVPSKAFGEVVEHRFDTPRIEPEELAAMRHRGENMVILDGRTPAEFARMSIPDGMSVPNGELVYRIQDIAPDPATTVVVNCAGRTRSIIGAQTLINAGIPNKVVALKGGTMAWRLAGFELDHGKSNMPPPVSEAGVERALAVAEAMRAHYAIPLLGAAAFDRLRAQPARTTYVLDVRSTADYEQGHLPGARSAPGGQLVQATDEWCAVWGARIVLVDEGSGVRATTAAHWLKQMGWDVQVLAGAADRATEKGLRTPSAAMPEGVESLSAQQAHSLVAAGTGAFVDVDESVHYRERRLPGALWACRPRMQRLADALPAGTTAILYSEHETGRGWQPSISPSWAAIRWHCWPAAVRPGAHGGGDTEASPGEPAGRGAHRLPVLGARPTPGQRPGGTGLPELGGEPAGPAQECRRA